MQEPGLDLHEWATRWHELQEAAEDDPEQTLVDMTNLVAQMLRERGHVLDDAVTLEGGDPEIVKQWRAAREVALLAERGLVEPEDVWTEIEGLGEIYEYLITDRAPP
jgi:hypothetical protein